MLFVGTAARRARQGKLISFSVLLSILWPLIQRPLKALAVLPEGL